MIAPQNIQLLDLLLGSQAASGKAKSPSLTEGQSSVPFLDILGLFVNPEQSDQETDVTHEAEGELLKSESSDVMLDVMTPPGNDLAAVAAVAGNPETVQEDKAVLMPDKSQSGSEFKSDLPFGRYSAIDASKIQQLINVVQVEPTTGTYEILDSKMVGGRLELAIAPLSEDEVTNEDGVKKNTSEIVKVSLPAKMFTTNSSDEMTVHPQGTAKTQRVSLVSQDDIRLENLFQKMNLKEIDIEIEQSEKITNATKQSETARVRLIGGDDKTVIAAALLPKKEIKLSRQPENGVRRASSISAQPERVDTGMESEYAGQSKNLPGSVVKNNFLQTGRGFDLLTLSPQNNQQGFDLVTDLSLSADANNSLETVFDVKPHSGGKTIYSSVRLSMPQTELVAMKSNGKSVTLRIEPDHLGPARISLTMVNNTLTARVTVQTMQARTVIEHSLDQLSDQLNRAGIKVESINVNVAGGNAQEQLPDRRPVWNRSSKHQTQTLRNEEEIQQVASVAPSQMIGRTTYTVGESLNLLA